MPGQDSHVAVKFLSDFTDVSHSFRCAAGAEYLVDAASASAFILTGIAVKIDSIVG